MITINKRTIFSEVYYHLFLQKPAENTLKLQIEDFVLTHGIINRSQYGFMAKSTTTAPCVDFVGRLQTAMDSKKNYILHFN